MSTYFARTVVPSLAIILSAAVPVLADSGYIQHNLIADTAGVADHTNANLVNAWGITHPPTGPWWINTNGTGFSILVDGTGAPINFGSQPAVVTIPPPPGQAGPSAPTGIVFNGGSGFQLSMGNPSRFIFVTEDGTISGWNPSVNLTNAVLKVNTGSSAVYKGAALGSMNGADFLYVANFRAGSVDVFDSNFAAVSMGSTAFQDHKIPAGFAPFNISNLNGYLFVTFAKQDDKKHDDVAGAGNGYVDVFTTTGTLVMRLNHGMWLNSPWAVTMAPANFGHASGRILVGNFGSGQIATFDMKEGEFHGLLRDTKGKPITIDGLWGLGFGNGATAGPANSLYFSAGPGGESHGLFGTLMAAPNNGHGDDNGGDDNGGDN